MLEIIIEAIVYIFLEILFKGVILGIGRTIKSIGIFGLKLILLSKKPFSELKEEYKQSYTPYFLGFPLTIGFIYLLVAIIS